MFNNNGNACSYLCLNLYIQLLYVLQYAYIILLHRICVFKMNLMFKYAVLGLLNLLCVNNEVVAVHSMDIWGLLTWGITLPLLYWSVILRYVPHCIYSLYPSYTVALVVTMVGWTECSKFSITMANTTTDLRSGIKFCAKNSEDHNVTSVGTDH